MTIPSRDWSAIDRPTSIVRGERELRVDGAVDLPSTSHSATLTKAEPQGFNPAILILELSIEQSGIGNSVITPRQVGYGERPIEAEQYTRVDVRYEGGTIATIEVSVVHS